jgi:hypothetical protein
MCWSCGCGLPDNNHGDSRNITSVILWSAGDAVGITVPQVVANIKAILKGSAPYENASPFSWMGKEVEGEAIVNVIKATEERRYTLGVAYPANRPDVSVAKDGYRDFVSEEVLEQTAWNWMKEHRAVSLFHADDTMGHAQVVESYIYRGPDWHQLSPVDNKEYVVKAGDWMLGTIWDSHGWSLVKSGLVNGWSPEGGAKRGNASADKIAALRKE